MLQKHGPLKATQMAVVRVSPKGGHIKRVYIYKTTPSGWVCGTESPEIRDYGSWYAPHNVLLVLPVENAYDYNGIPEGTLVQYGHDTVGIVTKRVGARYEVTSPTHGVQLVDWGSVHSVDTQEEKC